MSTINVSDVTSVRQLLEHPRCVARIRRALDNATRPTSADEFLMLAPWEARLAGTVAPALGKKLGLQSRTEHTAAVSNRYGRVLLGVLCAIAEQGISLTHLEERAEAEDCLFGGTVPSSAASYEGELFVHVTGRSGDYSVEASVTFMGQKFAWGRGKRILKRLFQDIDRQLGELDNAEL